ncbi:MAG: FAD-dependent oxidoreductase [Gemmatimonadales bacterium]|nr:FAD-dependent oxidoreductase [Gemmatimonadales bacterium]
MPSPIAGPLRIAIIGAGPSGFYAAEHLQKQGRDIAIDLFDRLPTPFGLVRGGVAPDHPKIKSVTRVYDKIAARPGFRFFGNVEFGRDVTLADLQRHYHAIVFSCGAPSDRALGIPGEDLPGSRTATEFVGWYNGHPDFRDLTFDLSQEDVVVVGVGNVAMDVARILCRTPEELAETDIASHALEALRESKVKTVYVLGRRGPAQAAFTNPEIKELGEMEAADIVVDPAELELDEASRVMVEEGEDRTPQKNLDTLGAFSNRAPGTKEKKIVMRFCVSPVALEGTDRVERVRIVRNRLEPDGRGGVRAVATNEEEVLPAGLVFRSVGYRGVALPGVPFDERRCVIPNAAGRVVDADGAPIPGVYAAGWIKRGPSGVIGTNKPDAVETVEQLLADADAGALPVPAEASTDALVAELRERGIRVVSYADWQRLDAHELAEGKRTGRPRLKLTRLQEMLDALDREPA